MPHLEAEEHQECKFKWIKKENNIQFYESFMYDGIYYSLYDCVYLHKQDEPECQKGHIGKLIRIWEDVDGSKKVEVQWFFQPSEISYYLKDEHVPNNELFLASGVGVGVTNVNPLEAIAGKCNVVCTSIDCRNRMPSFEELEVDHFVFYRTFNVETFSISDQMGEIVGRLQVEFVFNRKESLDTPNSRRLDLSDKYDERNILVCKETVKLSGNGSSDCLKNVELDKNNNHIIEKQSLEMDVELDKESVPRDVDGLSNKKSSHGEQQIIVSGENFGGDDNYVGDESFGGKCGNVKEKVRCMRDAVKQVHDEATVRGNEIPSPPSNDVNNAPHASNDLGGTSQKVNGDGVRVLKDGVRPQENAELVGCLTLSDDTFSRRENAIKNSRSTSKKNFEGFREAPKVFKKPRSSTKRSLETSTLLGTNLTSAVVVGHEDGVESSRRFLFEKVRSLKKAKCEEFNKVSNVNVGNTSMLEEVDKVGGSVLMESEHMNFPDDAVKCGAMDNAIGSIHGSPNGTSKSTSKKSCVGPIEAPKFVKDPKSNGKMPLKAIIDTSGTNLSVGCVSGFEDKVESRYLLCMGPSSKKAKCEEPTKILSANIEDIEKLENIGASDKVGSRHKSVLNTPDKEHYNVNMGMLFDANPSRLVDARSNSFFRSDETGYDDMNVSDGTFVCETSNNVIVNICGSNNQTSRSASKNFKGPREAPKVVETSKSYGKRPLETNSHDSGTNVSGHVGCHEDDMESKRYSSCMGASSKKGKSEKGNKISNANMGDVEKLEKVCASDKGRSKPIDISNKADKEHYDKNMGVLSGGISSKLIGSRCRSVALRPKDKEKKIESVVPRSKDEDKKMATIQFVEVTRRPSLEKLGFLKELCWKDRFEIAHDEGSLVFLQNLDPEYTSQDVVDIIWFMFQEKHVTARMVPQTAISSPQSGQAFVAFKSKQAADRVVKELDDGCLMLPNQRPLIGCIAKLSMSPGKHEAFFGHLAIDKVTRRKKEAKSTSHPAQFGNIEGDMALEWLHFQAMSVIWWEKLYEEQDMQLKELLADLKSEAPSI